jgi:hypothetical protein
MATCYGLDGPGGGEIFRTHPDRPWAHPASYEMGTGFLSWLGANYSHQSSAEVIERVELYLCSPCRPSLPVVARTSPLPLLTYKIQALLFMSDISLIVYLKIIIIVCR